MASTRPHLDAAPTPLGRTLLDRARTDPGLLAFATDGGAITFGELLDRAASRADGLESLGVARGSRVALSMSAGLAFVEIFWALQLLGAVPCAFNPYAPPAALTRRIARIRPHLVVTDERMEVTRHHHLTSRPDAVTPDDLAVLQLTSGTSGEPRASLITQRNIMSFMRMTERVDHMRRGDVLVSWVPPWHDLGLVHFVIGPVYFGVSCHIVAPSVRTIPDWLRTISEVGGTWSGAPDFVYRIACRMVGAGDVDLRSLRYCVNGGEPVRWSSIQDFERRFSVPGVVMPGYGLGETTLGVSFHLPGDQIKVDERGNVSCGRPIGGIEVVAGPSVAEPAEILVRGDTVFAGYLDAPDDTSRALQDGWLHTGDIGYLDADRRLFVLGRRRAMIKRAGAPIAPRELEEAALRVPAVRIAAAASLLGDHPGEDTIVVAVETASSDLSHDEISAAVYREVAADLGFGPNQVLIVAPRTIPRSENGKIRHTELAGVLRRQLPPT